MWGHPKRNGRSIDRHIDLVCFLSGLKLRFSSHPLWGGFFFVLFYWCINLFSILFMTIFKKKRYEDKKRTRNGKQNRQTIIRDNDHVFYF